MASTIEKVKAKVENAIHSNSNKNTNTTTTTTGTTGTTGATHSSHTAGTTHSGVPEGAAGPHSSRVANAADPRVDSDLDGRGGTAGAGYSTGTTGTTGQYNTGTGTGVTGGNAGYGSTGTTATTGTVGHNSNLANKLDPRVDTTSANTYDGTHTGNTSGGGLTGHGTTGGISNSTNAGPHDSNLANKVDPRVDSDLDGRGNRHGATTGTAAGFGGASGSHATPGSGTAQNTAGPHNSDLVNKLDPRVDADLDGSKTLGGNKTNY